MIEIVVNPDSFYKSNTGNLMGEIFFAVDRRVFPAEGWNDFISVILHWWVTAYSGLSGKNSSCKMRFMDGDWCVRAVSLTETDLELSFARYDGLEKQFTAACTKKELKEALICAIENTAEAAAQMEDGGYAAELASLQKCLKNMD